MSFNPPNILVIGDSHLPFELNGYHEWCHDLYDKYECSIVVHIGDLYDAYILSRHDKELSLAHNSEDEFSLAKEAQDKLAELFPNMYVILGNHDKRIYKKVTESNLPGRFIRDIPEAMEWPDGWSLQEELIIGNLLFTHNIKGGQRGWQEKMKEYGMNCIGGHVHARAGVSHASFPDGRNLYSALVGCGVNEETYAMAYGRDSTKRPVLSCMLIIDGDPWIRRYPGSRS